jgi:hypothetical protein
LPPAKKNHAMAATSAAAAAVAMITRGEAGERRDGDEAGGMQTNYGLPADGIARTSAP